MVRFFFYLIRAKSLVRNMPLKCSCLDDSMKVSGHLYPEVLSPAAAWCRIQMVAGVLRMSEELIIRNN